MHQPPVVNKYDEVRRTRRHLCRIIYLQSSDGSEYEIRYEVHVENGVTYWNEYYFNGSFYMKNTE